MFFSFKDKKVLNNGKDLEANGKLTSEAEECQERSSVLAVFKKVNDFSFTVCPIIIIIIFRIYINI